MTAEEHEKLRDQLLERTARSVRARLMGALWQARAYADTAHMFYAFDGLEEDIQRLIDRIEKGVYIPCTKRDMKP